MSNPNHDNFHLFRVRLPPTVWDRLRAAAKQESQKKREHVTASDLARAAMMDWLQGWESSERLGALRPIERPPGR